MQARFFRYLFENTEDGIVQSGCIWDRYIDQKLTYLYMAGAYCEEGIQKAQRQELQMIPDETELNIFVLGAYTIPYVTKLIELLRHRTIETIILPYIAPIQRLVTAQWMLEQVACDKEVLEFVKDPYLFLKKKGIENIYFVYGNGPRIEHKAEELNKGHHFELADAEILRLVEEVEGYYIPIVKAGYIVQNEWLFYFGYFGNDIHRIIEHTRNHCQKFEGYEMEMQGQRQGMKMQMRKMVVSFVKKFGVFPSATITMFQNPLYENPREIESLMTAKVFTHQQRCQVDIPDECHTCALKCLYRNDYDLLKKHKSDDYENSKFGMLITGNINLNKDMAEFTYRYWAFRRQIRTITVPNCGIRQFWNKKLLQLFCDTDTKYLICSIRAFTADSTLREILVSSSYHHLVNVNENYGYCFSGYLKYKHEV